MIDLICSRQDLKQKLYDTPLPRLDMKGYSETLDYLYGLEKFGIVFGLENIRWILSLLDNPQDSYQSIHVAGTNGKGSVASMVSFVP